MSAQLAEYDAEFAKPISWETLHHFLMGEYEKREVTQDVDNDVRFVTPSMAQEQTLEGIYHEGELVGFARWDPEVGHLSNLYLTPSARGVGLARRYLNARPLRSLYVMPENPAAIQLYTSVGFTVVGQIPTRLLMRRDV